MEWETVVFLAVLVCFLQTSTNIKKGTFYLVSLETVQAFATHTYEYLMLP